MDWRSFVHDHAIAVVLGIIVLVVILAVVVLVSLPTRAHMLKAAFVGLTWVAIAVAAGVIFIGLDILPLLGIASKDTELALMGSALIVVIAFMWRIGSGWALHTEGERRDLASKLKDAQKPVTLTLSGTKS